MFVLCLYVMFLYLYCVCFDRLARKKASKVSQEIIQEEELEIRKLEDVSYYFPIHFIVKLI